LKKDEVRLRHMLDAVKQIEMYVAIGRDEFMSNVHWQDAVVRRLEIIGEATKNVSSDIRDRFPDIQWRRIAGLRDVLIHDYMHVNLNIIWNITQNELPELKQQLEEILSWYQR